MIQPDDLLLALSKGNMTIGDAQMLFKFAEHRDIKVELGTAHGFGAMMLAQHAGYVYTIDNHTFYTNKGNFTPEQKHLAIKEFLHLYGDDKIKTIINDTVKEARNWEDESVDLLYVDGGHDYGQVQRDWNAWYPKVKRNAVILMHDISPVCGGPWRFFNKDMKGYIKKKMIKEIKQVTEYSNTLRVFEKLK